VDSVLKVRQGLQAPNQDATNGVINGASLVVPSVSASTTMEVNGAMQEQNGSISTQQQQQQQAV